MTIPRGSSTIARLEEGRGHDGGLILEERKEERKKSELND
eukprot:CAMPEP_0172377230 /NCGR_PEP_ID=MMETSP1060-20121228/68795_1 /TAXON_ID=37318 /ORGANISM="Pseudo-nitzschia pungens, Strain cf. cingulata" /LENGTH=39 /DNA_ID= /DNA_START= /DNA_END= /DNA_ORIENTATION=